MTRYVNVAVFNPDNVTWHFTQDLRDRYWICVTSYQEKTIIKTLHVRSEMWSNAAVDDFMSRCEENPHYSTERLQID